MSIRGNSRTQLKISYIMRAANGFRFLLNDLNIPHILINSKF